MQQDPPRNRLSVPRRLGRTRGFGVTLFIFSSVFVNAGCGKAPGGHVADEPEQNIALYTLRGRIEQLPASDQPAAQLVVHHEPLPSFRSGGKVIGMRSMRMPFPVASNVPLDGFRVGQPIEMTLEVEYDPDNQTPTGIQVTKMVALAEGTQLIFEDEPAN